MNTTKILPYVYKLTHKITSEFYIGVRWANIYPSGLDLGIRYKTSSKHVKPRFEEFNYEIVAEFFNHEDAIDFEQQSIEENWNDPLLLNKAIQVTKKFRCTGHSEKTKEKMSAAKKGKPPNNKGKKLSDETKGKIKQKSLLRRHTEETKAKMSINKIGNKNGIGNKSRTGQTQSEAEKEKKRIASTGKTHTEETKQKLSVQRKGIPKPKSECPECNKLFSAANMVRHICRLE